MTQEKLFEIASQFALEGNIVSVEALGEGFINDTFVVKSEGSAPDYILQRKNHIVFPDIEAMMDNIWRVTAHLKAKVKASGGDPLREVLISVGGSEAIDATLRAIITPGDEVIIPQPSYVCYEPMTQLCGGVPVIIETLAENESPTLKEQSL